MLVMNVEKHVCKIWWDCFFQIQTFGFMLARHRDASDMGRVYQSAFSRKCVNFYGLLVCAIFWDFTGYFPLDLDCFFWFSLGVSTLWRVSLVNALRGATFLGFSCSSWIMWSWLCFLMIVKHPTCINVIPPTIESWECFKVHFALNYFYFCALSISLIS